MPEIAVVDTSALIALEKINLLDILCRLYERIIVPEAVANEFGTLNIVDFPQNCEHTEQPLALNFQLSTKQTR